MSARPRWSTALASVRRTFRITDGSEAGGPTPAKLDSVLNTLRLGVPEIVVSVQPLGAKAGSLE
jgi:hypothetical protein